MLLQEDAETTYFNESVETARGAVADAFAAYDAVLGDLSEGERAKLQRSMGLKMEQLKVRSAGQRQCWSLSIVRTVSGPFED